MKIDMYTLLGLVKDGKAPKRIKYRQNIFEFIHGLGDYKPDDIAKYHGNYLLHYLFEEEVNFLNDEVEIPDDEDEEKEIPEKLEYEESDENGEFSINGFTFDFEQKIQIIKTVNEIIDFFKSKGE